MTPPPSPPEGAAEKRAMARKMKDVPLKETKMKLAKHRGSTYEMVVLNDPDDCKDVMSTSRKVKDEMNLKNGCKASS